MKWINQQTPALLQTALTSNLKIKEIRIPNNFFTTFDLARYANIIYMYKLLIISVIISDSRVPLCGAFNLSLENFSPQDSHKKNPNEG